MPKPDSPRPVLVALAGPNGAGKSTFFEAHFLSLGLRFINADVVANELEIGAYEAAEAAEQLRREMVARRESFVFETVLSDPRGAKVDFLREAAETGYDVLLCFIGVDSAAISRERVAVRVLQGGHGVPKEKLVSRYPRTLQNLAYALKVLPRVLIYDNSERIRARRFRFVAEYKNGVQVRASTELPIWFKTLVEPPEPEP